MNNQTRDSRTQMVRQEGLVHPDQKHTVNKFLAMAQAAQVTKQAQEQAAPPLCPPPVDPLPRVRTLAETTTEQQTNRAERRRKAEKAPRTMTEDLPTPPATEDPESAPAWLTDALAYLDQQEQAQATPRIRVQMPPQPPVPVDELLDLEPLRPKRGRGAGTEGAGALAHLMAELAHHHLAARPHLRRRDGSAPAQVVMHLPAEMVSEVLRVHDCTRVDWTQQLEATGYLHARPHFTTSTNDQGEQVTMVTGTLYAVRLQPGHTARVRYADLRREWRDLDADRDAGRTSHAAIKAAYKRAEKDCDQDEEKNTRGSSFVLDSETAEATRELTFSQQVSADLRRQLHRWAVIPGDVSTSPVKDDPRVFGPEGLGSVQDVVYMLPTVAQAHTTKRAALVGVLGATLARLLNDEHSRRYYCRLIWDAWNAEVEGRPGLQALAAQLERLEVDRREWAELCRPAALLASRMRHAA